MKLFLRKAIITVDTSAASLSIPQAVFTNSKTKPALQFICDRDNFDCTFDVHKSLTAKPNNATIEIFNLNPDHRAALTERAAQKQAVRVRLEAGYAEGTSRIFEGDIRILYHDRKGPDYVTRIETGDGDHIVATSRIFRSWGPGTPVAQVIKDVANALNLGEGNVVAAATGSLLEGWGPVYSQGTAVAGRTFDVLTRICKSAGLEWSIQDGTLQFLVEDKALNATAVLVTAQTGQLDRIKIDHKRRLHVRTLLIPDVFPGRKIQLEDKSVWKVDKAHYSGQTKGQNWHIDLEATPLSDATGTTK